MTGWLVKTDTETEKGWSPKRVNAFVQTVAVRTSPNTESASDPIKSEGDAGRRAVRVSGAEETRPSCPNDPGQENYAGYANPLRAAKCLDSWDPFPN